MCTLASTFAPYCPYPVLNACQHPTLRLTSRWPHPLGTILGSRVSDGMNRNPKYGGHGLAARLLIQAGGCTTSPAAPARLAEALLVQHAQNAQIAMWTSCDAPE